MKHFSSSSSPPHPRHLLPDGTRTWWSSACLWEPKEQKPEDSAGFLLCCEVRGRNYERTTREEKSGGGSIHAIHGEMEGGGREKEREGGERTPTVMERTAEHRRTDGEREA